jgi:cellulose synthase operon protein C
MTNKILRSGTSPPENENTASHAAVALVARLAHEIPKPRDWQAFQRNCALLFRAELNDPNAQEYGRSGQEQGGIDILGKRDGNPGHYVGIQCRHIEKPLTETAIMTEARAALGLKADLKELIFATTAPQDTHATNAAISVERKLRSEGSALTIVVYGWSALQNLIAIHDVAYAAFCPSIVATSNPQVIEYSPREDAEFAAQVANQVVEKLRQTNVVFPGREPETADTSEDPALHARIDTYRDVFRLEKQPNIAEAGLLSLLSKEPLENKPWAKFRILTNLGAIAVDLGRESEAATRFEAAYVLRPDDPNALANLAVARTIQGRYEEALELARRAMSATPRENHAVTYLLQAAARSSWVGDPESLIPTDMVGTENADLGLAEFLRIRQVAGGRSASFRLVKSIPPDSHSSGSEHSPSLPSPQNRAISLLGLEYPLHLIN